MAATSTSRSAFALLTGAVALALGTATAAAQAPNAPASTRIVVVGGHAVRVLTSGLDKRTPGSPVVVFEAGVANALDVWGNIPAQVSSSAPVVAYDRAGLGESAWDNQTPTPLHVSTRLRQLLQQIGAEPPFVLVGYSWGGILARYFAGYHPRDVAGLVVVDPGPLVTQSLAEQLASFNEIGAGRAGYDAFWTMFASFFTRARPAARAEFDVFRELMLRDLPARDLRPVPNVPIAVLVAAKYLSLQGVQLPYDPRAHFDADLRHRVKHLQEWALASPHGTFVVANNSTHAMPREDPGLIVWAVRRVLATVLNRP